MLRTDGQLPLKFVNDKTCTEIFSCLHGVAIAHLACYCPVPLHTQQHAVLLHCTVSVLAAAACESMSVHAPGHWDGMCQLLSWAQCQTGLTLKAVSLPSRCCRVAG